MGYRRKIDNIVIEAKLFKLIKNKLAIYKLKVKKVFRVRKGRNVYMVELVDGSHVRLDIYPKSKTPHDRFLYQKYLYESGVNVAKIIGLLLVLNNQWKISEWIEGVRIEEVWNDLKVFEKCGEQIAKLNSVKDPKTNCFLGLSDFTKLNLIWTDECEVYIIDLLVSPREFVDYSVVKTLIIGLRTKNRIDSFLKGYSRIRGIDKILEILENQEWKWKEFGLLKETKRGAK